jgi:hypothetical protein
MIFVMRHHFPAFGDLGFRCSQVCKSIRRPLRFRLPRARVYAEIGGGLHLQSGQKSQ